MSEESKIETVTAQAQSRRKFVKTSAQVAVTAPAATILLNASAKPAKAREALYSQNDDVTGRSDDDSQSDNPANRDTPTFNPGDDFVP
jgi:hypothetical protein